MFLYQIKNEAIAILGCRSYDGLVEICLLYTSDAADE